MAGLLAGLASLGLGNLENADIFGKDNKESATEGAAPVKIQEKDFLFDKGFECPVCDTQFTAKTIRTGKAKLIDTDPDLRPRYEGIDMVKYDVQVCPKCGYAALTRFFKNMSDNQIKQIKEYISKSVQLRDYDGETYTYDEALERYKLALACAVVKRTKASEKAYICLKSAWLLRGYAENLEDTISGYQQKVAELAEQENEYLKEAYEGFVEARQKEAYPMCGMDEITVDYLLSVLAARFKKYDVASRLIATILASPAANNRMKDKTRDLKSQILAELKKDKK